MTKRKINPLFLLYEVFIFIPLAITLSIITAIVTMVMCTIGNDKVWGFYPPRIWAKCLCWLSFVKVECKGLEHLDKNQSYVFACNHQGYYDIFSIYGWISTPFKWIMKKELEHIPFVGRACKAAGHIFVTRGNTHSALQTIEEAKRKLTNGLSVVIFPEGSRTPDGEVKAFKRGGFQIATDLHLPVVPVSINGSYIVLPSHNWLIKPHKIILTFHPPMLEESSTDSHHSEFMNRVRDCIVNDLH